jgi:hydrogenase nickel incorporation protein HypA/HybF
MHELSIAESILEIVRTNVPPEEQYSVKSVKLKVGKLAGVVADSLDFCFTAITQETPFKGVVLDIELIPFVVKCKGCGASSESEAGVVLCPACGSAETDVVSGTELQVIEIELHDNPVTGEQAFAQRLHSLRENTV